MFEAAIEAGADDVEVLDDVYLIVTKTNNLSNVREELGKKFGDPISAKFHWKAKNVVELEGEKAQTILKMVDALEDCDDVQSVTGNYVLPPSLRGA
jgi:transcriptional/translational regulatory protein YebC/TACO1